MRTSQRALLAALGLALLLAVAGTAWLHLRVSPAEELSGGRATLSPALTNPVAMPRGKFDTGEMVAEPPSVTEHTTRHLEQASRRDQP